MALTARTFNIANLFDGADGANYKVGQAVYVKNESGTYANIFRDQAGLIAINQDGSDNVTNSKGEFTFFIDDGSYTLEVNGEQRSFVIGSIVNQFKTVSDAINYAGVSRLVDRRLYIIELGAYFYGALTADMTSGDISLTSVSDPNYSFNLDKYQEIKTSMIGGMDSSKLSAVATFAKKIFMNTDEAIAELTIPDNFTIEGDEEHTLSVGSISLGNKSVLSNAIINLSSSTNPVSAISSNGANRPRLYNCTISGCPLSIECIRMTDTVGGKIIRCNISDGNRAVVIWGSSVACRARWLRADAQKGISVLLHTGQSSVGGVTKSYGHRLLNSKITNVGRGDSTSNPEAHGVQVWGMDAAQAARFHDIYDILVDDVTVETGTGAGIWTSCARRVKVRNCTVNNVRKEGIDFEGSLDCTNIGSDLYNAGRTFGSLTLIFRCDDCWHKDCTVVHDGDFSLVGGGEHPLVSSLSVYVRDANVRSGFKGNTFSARNANNKLTSFTVFKSTVDPNSATGSIGLLCESNEFLNGVVRYLDNCHKPKIVDNKLEFTGSYAAGSLTKSIYWVNCYEPNVKGNDIELNNGTTDSTTSSNNAVIFGLYNANPQRGYGAEIDDNKVRKFSSGITFQNFYSGRDSDGSFKATQNTVPSIFYSSTITNVAIVNNYNPNDFTAVSGTGI